MHVYLPLFLHLDYLLHSPNTHLKLIYSNNNFTTWTLVCYDTVMEFFFCFGANGMQKLYLKIYILYIFFIK